MRELTEIPLVIQSLHSLPAEEVLRRDYNLLGDPESPLEDLSIIINGATPFKLKKSPEGDIWAYRG